MRKFNAVLTAVILVLFAVHAVFGSFQMLGISSMVFKSVSYVCAGLVVVHIVIGTKLTIDTLRAQKKTGVSYFKENRLFWARRISGFAVMILLLFHFASFGYYVGDTYRLQWFDAWKLATQILLVLTLAIHIISNARPMLISFGIKSLKERVGDILFVASVLLLLAAGAFIVYYLRWNAL